MMRPRRPISARSDSCASAPAAVPTITMRPFSASASRWSEVRRADEPEYDARAALAADELERFVGSHGLRAELRELSARTGGAHRCVHGGAGANTDLHGGYADTRRRG
jgi:hypothetical protein